jgi:hypothetical protein
MPGDEREQPAAEAVALDHREDRAQHRAVRRQRVDGERARGQSSREQNDRDADVVHDDQGTCDRPEALRDVGPQVPLGELLPRLLRERVRRDIRQ